MRTKQRGISSQINQPMFTIGLDIGYGATKAVTDQQTIIFPSACGYGRTIKFQADEIAAKYPGDQILDDDGIWFVGDLALSQVPEGELLQLHGRTADEEIMGNIFRVRLAKVALGKLFAGTGYGDVVHMLVATGLPVDHMADAPLLKNALVGQHKIKTDTADFIANINDVIVMPQPYGTLYSEFLTTSGDINPHHIYSRTGICDVGTYTVDLLLDSDGEYIDAESGSIEGGVYSAQKRIRELLERAHRQKVQFKLIEETLRTGLFRASGKTVDYRAEVQRALEPLRSATLSLMSDKWKTGATVDVIFLTGGGAELVKDVVEATFQQAEIVIDAQTANARGYLNYARSKSK